MVSNMKTTIDISDPLLLEAKKLSREQHTTLRTLVEQGLRSIIAEHKSGLRFRLRKASFRGNGLAPDFQGEGWREIRSAAYEGHGE